MPANLPGRHIEHSRRPLPPLLIDGNRLTLEEVAEVAHRFRRVALDAAARPALEASRAAVEQALTHNEPVYGVTTGLGRLSDVRIEAGHIRELQINLVRSHACGVGEPLADSVVRAMMLLRANSLAKGYSGVRPAIVERLCEMLNAGVHPVVPSRGSVGASGDLAPLAHIALVMIGEGEAQVLNRPATGATAGDSAALGDGAPRTRLPGGEALRQTGIEPLQLEAKEGLSLLNGTQLMLAIGSLCLLEAERLVETADVIGAMTLDALRGTPVAFDARLQKVRGHPGQMRSAERLRLLLEGSEIRRSHLDCPRVQDAYSLRCMPQVHGAVRDSLGFARQTFAIEVNAAVDNPLVFVSGSEHEILSGGNFHGQPLAFALDAMSTGLAALAGISERRLERLVNPALSEGLPPFLTQHAGLHSGMMMAQVTAAALVAECRSLAHPASVESITTSGNKEDFVSMGVTAGLKLQRIVELLAGVLAIEALAAAQALEYLAPLKPGPRLQRAIAALRARVPPLAQDRVLAPDFAAATALIRAGALADVLND
jgi:histidine ammonia-lyase